MNIREVQQALKTLGFDPGPVDGIPGRQTLKAIKAFQIAHGLEADGLLRPATLTLLFQNQALPDDEPFGIPVTIPWAEEAFRLIGTQEVPGQGSNEAILGWAENLEISAYDDDDIPWCGLFVAHCVGSQLPDEGLPANPLGARQWAKFGKDVPPRFGAVMVFWRGSPDGWKGHVGFYWAEDADAYHVLGGNQSNAVTITRIAKTRLLTARWPITALQESGQIRLAAANGRLLSVNEA